MDIRHLTPVYAVSPQIAPSDAAELKATLDRHAVRGMEFVSFFLEPRWNGRRISDRANLFSVWQTLWQQGCGPGEAGERCRLQAFAAALDYARRGSLPAPGILPELDRAWTSIWPHGLAIPNPDLPNRDPLAALQNPDNDPLLLRPPLETWQAPDKTAFVVGLAGMLERAQLVGAGLSIQPRPDGGTTVTVRWPR